MSKPLMSEILKGTEEALKLADSQDVSKLHDFLFAEPGKPMLFVGNGGMQGHYASMLYEQYVGIGKMVPYRKCRRRKWNQLYYYK